jgi:drug/metabolite transporter (DMT)-like permease
MDTALPVARRTASAHAALALVVVFWAGSFSAIKELLDRGMAAPDIAIVRYVVAAPGFALLLWGAGGVPGLTGRDAVRLGLAGICVVVGYHMSLNIGTEYTTSGTAALVVALSPGLTLVLSAALGLERAGRRTIAGLAIAFAGVAVVVLLGAGGELSFANAKGPLIVVAAPVSFALYNVLLQPLLQRYGLLALTAASSLVGTLALLPFARGSTVDAVVDISAGSAALVLYLGIACTLFGYAAWNVGLRGLGPTRAVSYTYAIPALAVLMGAYFLDEPITVWLAVGGALVLGGIALAQRSRS